MPRPFASRRAGRAAPLAAALALATLAHGCRSERRDPGGDLHRYAGRGEIVKLPAAGGPREVTIRHEAIDDFANASGEVVGMNAMAMPFEVAPSVPLEDLRVGDKIAFRFAVGWSPPVLRVEELRKLPAETALTFGPARPRPAAAR
jgi:Cu/Ag efflux protein CusF